jgi:hypothetical protein
LTANSHGDEEQTRSRSCWLLIPWKLY